MFGLNISYSEKKYCYAYENLARAGLIYQYEKCPHCGRNIAHEPVKTLPDAYVIEGAKAYPDFLFYGGGGINFLVSEKVVNIFRQQGVTGFDTVTSVPLFRNNRGDLIPQEDVQYFSLNITGSIDLNLKAMSLNRKHICPECGQFDWSRQRLAIIKTAFSMESWDQSDLCRIASFPGFIVCTKKVRDIVLEQKFKGVQFRDEDCIFRAY